MDRWTVPNPFISELHSVLRAYGVELTDFSFNKEPANVGETFLAVNVRKLNVVIRVGVDHITYMVGNPDWGVAPQLVELFDTVSQAVWSFLGQEPVTQQLTLAFHVTPGATPLRHSSSKLVNCEALGDADFYGISVHRESDSLVIDKSLRYDNAAFIRIQRTHKGPVGFSIVARQLYADELKALDLLNISGVV